ncbi:MAG: hypothetical protein HFJ20_08245 [Clostridia bacterium]|nr:hypothetical protein [Clostridia bacterium]
MKSIFLLCEYGIPINTIINLDNEKISLEDLYNDINCLDDYLGQYSDKKLRIKQCLKKINEKENEYSVYELIKYGLSKTIIDKLYSKGIGIEDINETIKEDYHIGDSTYDKIVTSLNSFIEDKNINIGLTDLKILKMINGSFGHKTFLLADLVPIIEQEGYSRENLDKVITELKEQKKLSIKKDMYYIPYSVYELEKYGLSRILIKTVLVARNISFDEIDETMREKYHVTPAKNEKILNAYNKMVIDLDIKKELSKDILFTIIKKDIKTGVVSNDKIKNMLENKRYGLENFEELFKELLDENKIVFENDGYRAAYPRLKEELEKLNKDEKRYDMVMKKLSGYTLEQIGKEYSVTRERIRQIISKEFRKIQHVEEEKYKEFIENYDFKVDLFCKLFDLEEYVYYYLREKCKHGDLKPSELLDDNRLTSEQIEILRKEYNIIRYNDENIVADTIPILMAYLKREDRRVEFDELMTNYNQIITDYNLNLDLIAKEDFRNIDTRLTRTNFILDTIGKSYRYYNCNDVEEEDILELKEMFDIEPGVYSAELFFKDNPLLMKKLDVRDEYELHNLCKKVLGKFDEGIVYSRMPDIFVNCDNKVEFVEEQIQELSPINIDDFVKYMYNNYGHKLNTFKAYILNNFSHYINLNMLICNTQLFDDKQFEIMKEKLTEDIYSIATIKRMLTDLFDVNDFKLLNSLNLSKLGYRLRGNYIMKDSIINLESYLRDIIMSKDYYEISIEMRKIGSTFSSYLYKFIYDKILFKVSDEKYITIKKLNEMGIFIEDINLFIEEIEKTIPEKEYFNLYTLNTDFKNKILENNFPDCFYENLIMIIPKVKSFKMKNNTIFIRTNDSATREKFINSFVNKNKKYIKEIKNEIEKKYSINVEEYYIRQFINRRKFYLDSSTDCIYESREKYEEDINQWDILKYID